MRAAALLAVVALSAFGYKGAALYLGGTVQAWAYVAHGIEAAVLWLLLPYGHSFTRAEKLVCLFGLWMAVGRPIGRAMFPMDKAPPLKPGENLLDAATGFPVSALTPILLCWVIYAVACEIAQPTKVCSSNKQSDGAS